jgi:uncharacterized protein YndB with AHSA1/START domain
MTQDFATLKRADGFVHATFVRMSGHDLAKVWAMLTESAQLPLWLAAGEIQLHKGGAAKISFVDSGTIIDSIVSALEPGQILEYSWSAPGQPVRPLRWALDATPHGTQITLTVSTPETEDVARAAAGWEAHLDMLQAALEGVPIKFPFQRFQTARDSYRARIAESTSVPGIEQSTAGSA